MAAIVRTWGAELRVAVGGRSRNGHTLDPVELRLLGPFEIIDDDGKTLELRGAKLNGLLVVLALHAGEVVPTGRIIEDLWGEQEIRDPTTCCRS